MICRSFEDAMCCAYAMDSIPTVRTLRRLIQVAAVHGQSWAFTPLLSSTGHLEHKIAAWRVDFDRELARVEAEHAF